MYDGLLGRFLPDNMLYYMARESDGSYKFPVSVPS